MLRTRIISRALLLTVLAVVIFAPLVELLEDFVQVPELDELLLSAFFLLGIAVVNRESTVALLRIILRKGNPEIFLSTDRSVVWPTYEIEGRPPRDPLTILCDLRI